MAHAFDRRVELVSPVMRCALKLMLHRAEDWEVRNTWRERAGLDPLPEPFSRSVMIFLANLNDVRVEAERVRAAQLRRYHQERAAALKKAEQMTRPHVSRRVLHERAARRVQERKHESSGGDDAGREEDPVLGEDPGGDVGGVQARLRAGPDRLRGDELRAGDAPDDGGRGQRHADAVEDDGHRHQQRDREGPNTGGEGR